MRRTLPPPRTRRIAKWTGLVVCVVILAVWAVAIVAVLWTNKAVLSSFVLFGFLLAAMSRIATVRRILKWLALAACVAQIIAWAVSTQWFFGRAESDWQVTCYASRIEFGLLAWVCPAGTIPAPPSTWIWQPLPPYDFGFATRPWWQLRRFPNWLGFNLMCMIPLWLPLAITGGAMAMLFWADRRRYKEGHCQDCGYDLRASKGKCPECATPIAPEPR